MLPRKSKIDLGRKLRIKRQTAQLTLKQLSTLLGGHPSMFILHRIETHKKRKPPKATDVRLIQEFLKLPYQIIQNKMRLLNLGRK